MGNKGIVKEHLLRVISVTTQADVSISRRVSRFKLRLRDHQEVRRSSEGGYDRPTLTAWG